MIHRQWSFVGRSTDRLISSIWVGTHWYLLQVGFMGVYGYYVSTNRQSFPPTPCNISPFSNGGFRMFARVVYIIAMIPVVNVGLLCALLVGTVWALSWIATYLRDRHAQVVAFNPAVFSFFWFFVCSIIALVITITTEAILFAGTDGQNIWSFGSLLALFLLVIPAETFVGQLYSTLAPNWSQRLRHRQYNNI